VAPEVIPAPTQAPSLCSGFWFLRALVHCPWEASSCGDRQLGVPEFGSGLARACRALVSVSHYGQRAELGQGPSSGSLLACSSPSKDEGLSLWTLDCCGVCDSGAGVHHSHGVWGLASVLFLNSRWTKALPLTSPQVAPSDAWAYSMKP
jgi:hypothetical protein